VCLFSTNRSFGAEVYSLINATIHAREALRPYVIKQLALTSARGRPLMRPLFFDFGTANPASTATISTSSSGNGSSPLPPASPDDVWWIDDEYMFGTVFLPIYLPSCESSPSAFLFFRCFCRGRSPCSANPAVPAAQPHCLSSWRTHMGRLLDRRCHCKPASRDLALGTSAA
jgi:hypothetical protein